ncbi:MAG: copper resistance protein NlpE [Muribaculaceae bacterium]|nr:copper resistance protein NlpE [Muribaculaceae bacterium]
MKKTVLMMLAVASLGFASCDNTKATAEAPTTDGDKEVLYSGILPSADAQGTVYTLKLEFDDDHNYTDGDYTLVENTLAADTVAASGLKEVATSYSKGDFRKESKVVDGTSVNYIRLTPDAKDALGTPSGSSLYFVINEDESLTMVGPDLEKSVNPELNYTLTVK